MNKGRSHCFVFSSKPAHLWSVPVLEVKKNTIQCVYLPVIMNEISFSPVVILVTGFPPFPVEALSVRAELSVLFN